VGSATTAKFIRRETSMADFKQLAKKLLLADGKIDEQEVKILRKELYADGVIDKKEVEFLIELRNAAKKVAPAFTRFFFKAIKDNVLQDGQIDAAEARWLRTMLYADGKIDADEKKFMKELKREAKKVSSQFETLYEECMG
jgi:uncharacterized tellurite resistance protein B-like protein